jgi:hypothetical protein
MTSCNKIKRSTCTQELNHENEAVWPKLSTFRVIVPCFAHQYRLGLGFRVCIYVYGGIQLTLQYMYTKYPLYNVYYIGARNMERLPLPAYILVNYSGYTIMHYGFKDGVIIVERVNNQKILN